MEHIGEVVSTAGDQLEVVFKRPADCEKCGMCKGNQATRTLFLSGHAAVGDRVLVSMPDGHVLAASVMAYVPPLLGFIAGLFIGNAVGVDPYRDITALIGCAVGLGLSFIPIRIAEKRIKGKAEWQPTLVSVIKNHQEV